MTEKTREEMLLVYVSRCLIDDKGEGRTYYRVRPEDFDKAIISEWDDQPDMLTYTAKGTRNLGHKPGMVYTVDHKAGDPSTIFPGTAQYYGLWPDDKQRAEWQARDAAIGQTILLMKRVIAGKRDDAVLDCLEPIRQAYKKARGIQRDLILARAVKYITR